jgi:6-phosphogluconolactonase (cycloisomerase 2 family)
MPVTSDGLHFSSTGTTLTFTGSPSHPHQVYEVNGEVLIPDLGADQIWRLSNSGGTWKNVGGLAQPKGSGPRHVQVVNGTLFVLHELASTLTAQPLGASGSSADTSAIVSSVYIVPPDAPSVSSGAKWQAAEILIPPTSAAFPTQYIYASNRNTGTPGSDPRGDAITVLTYTNNKLNIVGYSYTGISQVRGMEFGGPDNQYLIAGGVVGTAGVAVFQRTNGGANLTLIARDTTLPTRTSFVWL